MGTIASQITSLAIVYSIVYSSSHQRKHQSPASLAFVRGIHRGPVNSPHKWPVTRKMFPFDDVIMYIFGYSCLFSITLAYLVILHRTFRISTRDIERQFSIICTVLTHNHQNIIAPLIMLIKKKWKGTSCLSMFMPSTDQLTISYSLQWFHMGVTASQITNNSTACL